MTPHVSTGRLPAPDVVRRWLEEAHERFAGVADGEVSAIYPALARVPPELFGISVAGVSGAVHDVGDTTYEFTLMSVSKPFVFAIVCDAIGAEEARGRLGVNATGLPFNSLEAVERDPRGRTNPMVNAGAIATTSLAGGWQAIHAGLSRFATRDMAIMGGTLAHGGVNPVTGAQVVAPLACHYTLAVMATAGLYEHSGDWLYEIGQPAKSGISGGIVTVAPGKGGLATFAPPLDGVGNSVRGRLAAAFLSSRLGLDLFLSTPAATT